LKFDEINVKLILVRILIVINLSNYGEQQSKDDVI